MRERRSIHNVACALEYTRKGKRFHGGRRDAVVWRTTEGHQAFFTKPILKMDAHAIEWGIRGEKLVRRGKENGKPGLVLTSLQVRKSTILLGEKSVQERGRPWFSK